MNKHIFILTILCFASTYSFSQKRKVQHNPNYDKRKFHLGYTIGVQSQDFRITPNANLLYENIEDKIYSIESINSTGINLSFISDLRLGPHFNLRFQPGLILGQKTLQYSEKIEKQNQYVFADYIMHVPSYYIDVPMLLKFRAKRINNYRPYVIAGMATKYNVEKSGVVRQNTGYTIKQVPLDYFYEFGVGIDFYLVYFKLGTELKFSYGLRDILIHEQNEHASVIDRLQSRMLTLALHFE